MSIRLLALDLYRCRKQVETLEKQLAGALPEDRPAIEAKLRAARAEKNTLRRALDGRIGR